MAFEADTVKDFLDVLASGAPAPGGGSAAALGGAIGAALVTMVSGLTVGKEKYKDNWTAMEETAKESERLRAEFVRLMNEDTESFNAFMAALKMPRETDKEKANRKAALESASKKATEIPLSTLERCAEMASLAARAVTLGNASAASDAGSAALLAEASGRAASYNVRINLPGIKDEAFSEDIRKRMAAALNSISKSCAKSAEDMDKILG
ncbi:MAG: cyclodeaminase/cyclohydrolase family protein [Synergistaceae bacterium]|jgi:glutamate formiminotransferase/formiminotetrahydrofolate cyclodeaminase|nr:cyclodeaminase/cyclohydrolase family protein [Synergistaceae bacterium]